MRYQQYQQYSVLIFYKMFFALYFLLLAVDASALTIGETTYFMPSDKSFIAKIVKNDTDRTRIYDVVVIATEPPYKDAKQYNIPMGSVMYNPKQLLLRPNESNLLKLHYQGAEDDLPRYYRVIFREKQGVLLAEPQSVHFSPNQAIATILVVQPRKARQSYQLLNNKLINNGNTIYLATVKGPCTTTANKECLAEKYLIPDMELDLSEFDLSNSTIILLNESLQVIQPSKNNKVK